MLTGSVMNRPSNRSCARTKEKHETQPADSPTWRAMKLLRLFASFCKPDLVQLPTFPVNLRCLCLVFFFVAAAPAAEWPEFRGPTGQGHSTATNLPIEWGPEK